jgi:hypothetical protein
VNSELTEKNALKTMTYTVYILKSIKGPTEPTEPTEYIAQQAYIAKDL